MECAQDSLSIAFDDVVVFDRGEIRFDEKMESKAAAVMQKESFRITCDLGKGKGRFVAYGCDLGYEYVKINADYRS